MAKKPIDGTLNDRLQRYKYRHAVHISSLFTELINLAGDVDRFLQSQDADQPAQAEYEVRNMRSRLGAIKERL